MSPGVPWLVAAEFQSLPLGSRRLLLSLCLSLTEMLVIGFGTLLIIWDDLTLRSLTSVHLPRPVFKINPHLEGLGRHILWWVWEAPMNLFFPNPRILFKNLKSIN